MDPLTIIIATIALAAVAGLCWLGGYELGCARGAASERQSINALIEEANRRRIRGNKRAKRIPKYAMEVRA